MKDLLNTILERMGCLCNDESLKSFNDTIYFGINNNYESIKDVKRIK